MENLVSTTLSSLKAFGKLGKEIKVSPKAHLSLNNRGYKKEYFVDTVTVTIGIGDDHTADLTMTVDAWEALNSGEQVNITTVKEFEQQFGG